MECWNCQAETHGAAFCPACGRIGPRAPGATHFDVFGISPGYDVDLDALEKQYRDLSLKLHPDRFAHAEARERRLSLEQTAALNEAWRVIKDPVRRAFYLLRLHGVNLEEEQAAERAKMPMEFLEEVMELREALAEAAAEKNLEKAQQMAGDVAKVNQYLDARGLRRSQVFAQLIQALIEQSRTEGGAEERSILERLQNYLKSMGSTAQAALGLE